MYLPTPAALRNAILAISAAGTLLFALIYALSYLNPILIERAAREVIRIEVERRAGEKIDALSNSRIVGMAEKMLRKTDAEIEQTRKVLRNEVPARTATVVLAMLDPNCPCRKQLAGKIEQVENDRLTSLTALRAKLSRHIESVYATVTAGLMRELRIFSASNTVAFALLGLITLLRKRDARQLVLPAAVLLSAVCITGSVYLFSQNWLHTIIYSDYVGLGYAAYLAAVALSLADIAFNKGNVNKIIIHAMLALAGAAAAAIGC